MSSVEQSELKPGTVIGQYEILAPIAHGGMGLIYKARHITTHREVAIKFIYPALTMASDFMARFRREGEAMARLRHPNIAEVYEIGFDNGFHYIAMEYVPGGNLRDRIASFSKQGQYMPLKEALSIARQIALALDYAHSLHLVHRDIKPSNILLRADGTPVLADFGVVLPQDATVLTQTGSPGTPEYMSPEQSQGLRVDGRSDIYSLGVMLYEMLTGKVPFTGDTPWAVINKHVKEPPPSITHLRPGLPPAIRALTQKALAKQPKDRFQTAAQLASAIDATQVGEKGRFPLALAAVGVLALLLLVALGAGIVLLNNQNLSTHTADQPTAVLPANTATPAATSVPAEQLVAIATATAMPSAAPIMPTGTPFASPTSEATVTAAPTSTPAPAPTSTPLPTTAPSTIAAPVATSASQPAGMLFTAPVLVSPAYNAIYQAPNTPLLQWKSSATLGPDDYYFVQIHHTQGVDPYYVKDTSVTPKDYLPGLSQNGLLTWQVSIVRKTGNRYTPVSPSSDTWQFYWSPAGQSSGPSGGGSKPTLTPAPP